MKIIAHFLEMLGIEPWTSYMKSRRSTAELHPHLMRVFSAFVDLETLQIQLWEIILHESHRTVLGDTLSYIPT